MTIPTSHRLLRALAHAIHRYQESLPKDDILGLSQTPLTSLKPSQIPIAIAKLTILHSFEPESLGDLEIKQLESVLGMFAPKELDWEFFSGEKVIDRNSLDTVAKALRSPWGYFGTEHKYKVVIGAEDEEEGLNGGDEVVVKSQNNIRSKDSMGFNRDTSGNKENAEIHVVKEKKQMGGIKKKPRLETLEEDEEENQANGHVDKANDAVSSIPPLLSVSLAPRGTAYQPQSTNTSKRKRSQEDDDIQPHKAQKYERGKDEVETQPVTTCKRKREESDSEKEEYDEVEVDEKHEEEDETYIPPCSHPYTLNAPEFDPTIHIEDRITGYIYTLENRYSHLPHPQLENLEPSERERREIWKGLFGENDDLHREFSLADKKWLQKADKGRLPKGWIPPLGWKINSMIGENLLSGVLETWQGCLEVLSIRGHWMNLYQEVSLSSSLRT